MTRERSKKKRKQFDVSNERSIIAAACRDSAARAKVLGACTRDCFHDRYAAIFDALAACGADEVVDVALVVHRAGAKACGGRGYVEQVFETEPPANLEVHIESLLKDHARETALADVKDWIGDLGDKTVDYDSVVHDGAQILRTLAEPTMLKASGVELADDYLADLAERRAGNVPFRSTGYDPFDEVLTYGLAPKLLTIGFGRPRNGKTSFMIDWIPRLLRQKDKPRILVMSCEEDRFSLMDMLVCNVAELSIDWLARRTPDMTNQKFREVCGKVRRMIASDDRLVILGNPYLGMGADRDNESVLRETERIAATGGYDVVFHDMWQRSFPDKRPQRLQAALETEHHLAEMYGYHKVIFHQAKQDVEERRDKRPRLDDLKDTGGYNEVADVVLGMHRERAYNPATRRNVVEVEVLKQKKGVGGEVMEADFVGGQFRLENERLADIREESRKTQQEGPQFMQDDPI